MAIWRYELIFNFTPIPIMLFNFRTRSDVQCGSSTPDRHKNQWNSTDRTGWPPTAAQTDAPTTCTAATIRPLLAARTGGWSCCCPRTNTLCGTRWQTPLDLARWICCVAHPCACCNIARSTTRVRVPVGLRWCASTSTSPWNAEWPACTASPAHLAMRRPRAWTRTHDLHHPRCDGTTTSPRPRASMRHCASWNDTPVAFRSGCRSSCPTGCWGFDHPAPRPHHSSSSSSTTPPPWSANTRSSTPAPTFATAPCQTWRSGTTPCPPPTECCPPPWWCIESSIRTAACWTTTPWAPADPPTWIDGPCDKSSPPHRFHAGLLLATPPSCGPTWSRRTTWACNCHAQCPALVCGLLWLTSACCLPLPHTGKAGVCLPEYSIVYIVTPLALDSSTKLRFHNRCACRGASILST